MIRHLKHIITVLIFLSLLGIRQNLPVAFSGAKTANDTEWVAKAGGKEKVARCCHFLQHLFDAGKSLVIKTWTNDNSWHYHQKVKVQIISRIKIQYIVTSKSLLTIKLNYSNRSIEDYMIS